MQIRYNAICSIAQTGRKSTSFHFLCCCFCSHFNLVALGKDQCAIYCLKRVLKSRSVSWSKFEAILPLPVTYITLYFTPWVVWAKQFRNRL